MDKSPGQFKSIDEYIHLYPQDIQDRLHTIRTTIKEEVPEAVESISYQMPAFKFKGKPFAYFAVFKDHIGFFPTASPIEKFKEDLQSYKTSKGTIQFSLDQPLPLPLIRKIVQYRAKEIQEKYK